MTVTDDRPWSRRGEHDGPCLNYEGQNPDAYSEWDSCYRHIEASDRYIADLHARAHAPRRFNWHSATYAVILAAIVLFGAFLAGYHYRSTLPFCQSVTEDSVMVGCDYRDGEWYTDQGDGR